jgi:hypothetical protein
MSSRNLLERLDRLDKSSSNFHDRLCNVLYAREYRQCLLNLQDDDLMWFVEYLDRVRCGIAIPRTSLRQRRLLVSSILLVSHSGSVYENSEAYVAPG